MSARSALLVNATELLRQPGTRRHVDVRIPLVDVDVVDDRLTGDIGVDVTLESTLDDIDVAGQLRVAWSDACRRCLRPLSDVLVVDIDDRYAAPDETGQRLLDPAAFRIEHGQLDLAPMVREEVLLGVPDAPLCRPDCPGLCPTCGADLQLEAGHTHEDQRDERWAALDQLRPAESGQDSPRHEPSDRLE